MRRTDADAWVLARVKEHPGCTSRELAAARGNGASRSSERSMVNAALGRLEDRGQVYADRSSSANRWYPTTSPVDDLVAVLTDARAFVRRAAAGAKLHKQDQRDAEALLPRRSSTGPSSSSPSCGSPRSSCR
jgi:hypothetical protein